MAPRLILAVAALATATSTAAAPLGDVAACEGGGPAILVTVTGMKDRAGEVKLELYPPNAEDFLKDDRDLIAAGRFFRRIRVAAPSSGSVQLCIGVPRPGRYALLFSHNRSGKNKFSFWSDGAGFPSNQRLGRSRPTVDQALVTVGTGVTRLAITAQYLRGLGGFGPIG